MGERFGGSESRQSTRLHAPRGLGGGHRAAARLRAARNPVQCRFVRRSIAPDGATPKPPHSALASRREPGDSDAACGRPRLPRGPEVLKPIEESLPPLARGLVRIEVEAIGVNFGDILIRQGTSYISDASLSIRPGYEVAGRVLETMEAGPATGQRVVAFVPDGGYASIVDAPARQVVPIVDDLTSVQAAGLLIQGITAWYAVHRYGAVSAGDLTLLHAAAGGVGGIAVQLVRELGGRTIAIASSREKREVAPRRQSPATPRPSPMS